MKTDEQPPPKLGSLQLLRISEITALLGVSRTTIYEWRKKGLFPPAIQIGSGKRFKMTDVAALIGGKKTFEAGVEL